MMTIFNDITCETIIAMLEIIQRWFQMAGFSICTLGEKNKQAHVLLHEAILGVYYLKRSLQVV